MSSSMRNASRPAQVETSSASVVPVDSSFAALEMTFSVDEPQQREQKHGATSSKSIDDIVSSAALKARNGTLCFSAHDSDLKSEGGDTAASHVIETPAIVNYTKKGSPVHLSRDNVDRLPVEMVMLAYEHLLEYNPPCYLSAPFGLKRYLGLRHKAASSEETSHPGATNGLSQDRHTKARQQPHILFANLRDAADQAEILSTVETFIPCRSFRGVIKMSPERYLDTAFPRPPDVLLALADEPLGHANSQKRLAKSLVRSEKWLKACIARNNEKKMTNIFAPLVGGTVAAARQSYVDTLAQEMKTDSFAGYSINLNTIRPQDHSGPDETSGSQVETTGELIDVSLAGTDASKPRLALCPSGPHEILELVSAHGLDLFMDEWSTALSSVGIALDFTLPAHAGEDGQPQGAPALQPLGISLFDKKYARDFTSLASPATMEVLVARYGEEALGDLPTKAYLYHLLHAHEMTSHVLLAMHNTCVMDYFMASIRGAISAGTLEEQKAIFDRTYTRRLAAWDEANTHWKKVNSERGKGRLKGLGQDRRSEVDGTPKTEQERLAFDDTATLLS